MSVSEAHVATSSCLEAFGALRSHLQAAKPELAAQVPDADVEDEFGRFRLWAANIGALSRGHSSLDYRLRDAPLVLEGALKLLNELQQELHQMCLVLSGARLPYEAQISSRASHVDDSDTSSLSSDSESSSDSSSDSDNEKLAPSELRRRVSALSNINDNLYRLSRSIRAPASHSRSLKALSYKLIDKETGVDVVQQFAPVDLAFTKDLFSQLRRNAQDQYADCPALDDGDLAMIERLAQGITRRRQQFLYWKHHRKKLGFYAEKEILKIPKPAPTVHLKEDGWRESVAGPRASLPVIGKAQTESSRPKTTLTETTATLFIAPANAPDGNQSVTSYATTARGLDGSRIELPKLPKDIKKGKDFECPYCLMICPPHYQMPRAWRTHLLRDLRPYMCTHKHCQQPDELFATKQEWLNHEHTHQKAWQCPEHASTHFLTQDDLKRHLLAENHESLQRMDLGDLLAISETVRPDSRTICPICFVDAGSSYGLENHLANHLERFAAFALPRDVEGDADEESPENSNMSDHAIARSDQSEDSDISYAFANEDKKAEIETLVRMTRGISSTAFSDAYFPGVDKLHNQMISIVNLPTEILDKLNVDLQFKAVFKTIPRLLIELKEFVASDDGDDFQECASELIFQMERLDSILQEYAVDFALESFHPRLGIDTVLSHQSSEDGRERNQDGKLSPPRDSSPDSVVNRTGPRLSTMDLNRSRTSDSAEEAASPTRDRSPDSIVNRASSILSTMDLNKFQTSNPAEGDVSPTRDSSLDSPVNSTVQDNIIVNPFTRINMTESESFYRKQLTTYEVFTILPYNIESKKEERWAKITINQESYPTEQIIKAIQKLDAGILSVIEKKTRLSRIQNAHVTNIVDAKIDAESEGMLFECVLAQLHCEESTNPKTGEKETTSITIYLKRIPRPGFDVFHLYRERQERARMQPIHGQQEQNFQQQAQAIQQQQQDSLKGEATKTDLEEETKSKASNSGEGDKPTEEPASKNMPRNSPPFLIATLTSLLTRAHPIQQRLQDIATEGKVTSNALVILKRIFPGICVSITRLIAMLREGVLDPFIVLCIEEIDTKCRRLFEDASTFLEKYKKSTRLGLVSQKTLGWGSKKQYREDKLRLVTSAQSVEEEINYTLELHARGRTLRNLRRDQDEPISPLSIESRTLTADNVDAKGGLSKAGEHEQTPESPKNSQDTDNIQALGLEDGSKVGHRTSELSKLIASQRDSADTTRYTPIDGPIIIDERPIKGILKPGRNKFPEDPSPTREGFAPLRDELNDGIYVRPSRAEGAPPPDARWTKINRLLVNPQALDDGGERYEARDDFVIVLRVLSKEEIQVYADATAKIRAARGVEDEARDERKIKRIPPPSPAPEGDASDGDDEGNNSEFEGSHKRKLAQLRQTQQESRDLQKEEIPGDARGTKIDRKIVSPETLTRAGESFEDRDDFSPRVGSAESAQLLPHGFMGVLEKRMTGVLTMKERLPGYSDPAVKRSFAEAYTAFTKATFRRRMEQERRVEDLVLVFYANVVKSLQKGKPPGDDSWKNLIYRHVALFLRLLCSTMKDHGYDKDSPELMSRLATAEKQLMTDDQDLSSWSSARTWSSVISFLHKDEVKAGRAAALLALRADGMEEGGDVREGREGRGAPMLEWPPRRPRHGTDLEQTIAVIARMKGVTKRIQEKWDTLHSFIDPPEAFLEEAKHLESVLRSLKATKPKEHELDDATINDLKQILISCLEMARQVDKIFKEEEPTRDEDGKLSRSGKMVVPRFKSRLPAEEFIQGVIRDVRFISTNMQVGFITKEQPANLIDAIKEMGGTPLPNPDPYSQKKKSDTIAIPSTEDRKKNEADDEGGWSAADSRLYKADNLPISESPDEDEADTNGVFKEPRRPSSATSSLFDDDVVLNPHTLPRGSVDTSPVTERNANPSHQSAKIDNKRLPGNNYFTRPPLSSSAYYNPPSARTTSTAPIITTTFPCTFAFAGCSSVFTLKDYWKRHVANNHMSFVHWKCPLKPCPRPLFDTDDLLEGHLKWVHEVPDDQVAALVDRGEQPGRSLIKEIYCPAPGCIEEWDWMGSVAWDERMEHVAKHWDAVAKGEEEGGWTEEGGGLLEWAIKEGAVREVGGRLLCQEGMAFKRRDNSIDEEKPTYDEASTLLEDMGHTSHNDEKKPVDDNGFGVPPPTKDPTTHRITNRGEAKASVRFAPEHEAESPRPPSAKSMTLDDDKGGGLLDIDTGSYEYPPSSQRPLFVRSGLDYDAAETTHRDEGEKPIYDADVDAPLDVNNPNFLRQITRAKAKLEALRAAKQLESQTSPHDYTTMPRSPPVPSRSPLDLEDDHSDVSIIEFGTYSSADGLRRSLETLHFLDVAQSSVQETKHRIEVGKPTDRDVTVINHNVRMSDPSEPRSGDSRETKGLVRRMSARLSSRSSRNKPTPTTQQQQTTPRSDEGKNLISDGTIDTPPQTTNPTTRLTLPRPEPRLADRLAAARRAAKKLGSGSQTAPHEPSTEHPIAPGLSSSAKPSQLSPVTPSGPDAARDYDEDGVRSPPPPYPGLQPQIPTDASTTLNDNETWDLPPAGLPRPSPLSLALDDEDALAAHPPTVSEEEDEEDDAPMDEKQISRLKRVFSMRNWTTEKGRGEQKGKGKDKEENGGAGGSGRRRSGLGF
ncbi:hypothetical protein VF21_05770 [Pseudogymnoascus sp. 05NY08]|nr:hypothetical protein VF21_05770 [Pseudogymnoascus sp. 05NY08]